MTLPVREASGFLGDSGLFPSMLTGMLRVPHAPSPPAPVLSLPHFLLPIARPSLPAPSRLVHRPLTPKHPPLHESIHRSSGFPVLVREFLHRHSNGT